jgi:hypothetical protein
LEINKVEKVYGVYYSEEGDENGFKKRVYRFPDDKKSIKNARTFHVIHYRRTKKREVPKKRNIDPKISTLSYNYEHVSGSENTAAPNDVDVPTEHDRSFVDGNIITHDHHLKYEDPRNIAPTPLTILNFVPKYSFVNVPAPDLTMILVLRQYVDYPFPIVKIRFCLVNTALITECMGQFITGSNITCSLPRLDMGR